ncbi:MAG TPA: hypothetical protein VEP48_02005 [Methylomirabilota bacterium]|nr:hypothetical protein [Methylomirabilota bacterium]
MQTTAGKTSSPSLKVIFDTSAVHVDSATGFVRSEIEALVQGSYPDLTISWLLPSAVRHEREYQMLAAATALLPKHSDVQELLGFSITVTGDQLQARLDDRIAKDLNRLGVTEIGLDYSKVDWSGVVDAALYRKPPFQHGKGREKGFRDCLVALTVEQVMLSSPSTPKVCRVVFVCGDELLRQVAVDVAKKHGRDNVHVCSTVDDLKELLSTISSAVTDEFITKYRPIAEKFFFVKDDKSTLYFVANIRATIEKDFASMIRAIPADTGATQRRMGTWLVYPPTFVAKKGQRVTWNSRIDVPGQLTKDVVEPVEPAVDSTPTISNWLQQIIANYAKQYPLDTSPGSSEVKVPDVSKLIAPTAPKTRSENVGKVTDTFNCVWSATMPARGKHKGTFTVAKILSTKHVETTVEKTAVS